MTVPITSEATMHIVGGVYRERCMHPCWQEVYGSAGRAASAIASMGIIPTLHSYFDAQTQDVLAARAALENFKLAVTTIAQATTFDYDHGLATPRIYSNGSMASALEITEDRILRFGIMEGDAIVHGRKVVYDPQNATAPKSFHENGSTAEELALVLNMREAMLLGGINTTPQDVASALINNGYANVVVIKRGPMGALVHDGHSVTLVPAYRSQAVWKMGSGDNFAAHFAFRWMHEGKSAAESADLASHATAYYCETRGFGTPDLLAAHPRVPIVPSDAFANGRQPIIYLAGPFFTLAELWLVEQVRNDLRSMGLKVFSPYHDVGHGCAEDVVALDLQGIDGADIVFAIGDGMDSGTVYEIGYARAKGKPVCH